MKKTCLVMVVCAMLLLTACKHEHSYGKWEIDEAATCEEDGVKLRECDCGEEETKVIPKLEHDYESAVTQEASCQGVGVMTYTCDRCDGSYTEELAPETYTSTELYEMYLPCVGEVITYDKSGSELALGSCFVYSEDGRIITNYHVIEGAYAVSLTIDEQTYEVEKILAYDKDIDVAVLEISAAGLVEAVLCDADHAVGEAVYAFGNSKGLTSTFSDGIITYPNREYDGIHYVQHDAPISGGNSGGPLINIYGEVIGINTWTVSEAQNLNFAIHLSELEALDYDDPMTVEEYYEKECDAYSRIKNYVMEEGEYSDGEYLLLLGYDYSSDYTSIYYRLITYDPAEDQIILGCSVDNESFVMVSVDPEISGIYSWGFMFDDYYLGGTLYAASFDDDSLLSYTDYNIYSSEVRTSARKLASAMLKYFCANISTDFAELGVTAADLGFVYF